MKKKKWDRNLAIYIAKRQGISLNIYHWRIIFYYRSFYFKYNILPNTRNLLNYLNNKFKTNCDSIFLFKLFPKGFNKQIIKITCLPDNIQCF